MTLKAKLYAAASTNAELQALLTNGAGAFQWADMQLPQQWDLTNFSAVSVFQVSAPRLYSNAGRSSTYWARVQFAVFGHGNDSQNASAVVQALTDFLATFCAYRVPVNAAAYENRIVNDRDAGIAQTAPLTYQRIIDVLIWNDETV